MVPAVQGGDAFHPYRLRLAAFDLDAIALLTIEGLDQPLVDIDEDHAVPRACEKLSDERPADVASAEHYEVHLPRPLPSPVKLVTAPAGTWPPAPHPTRPHA